MSAALGRFKTVNLANVNPNCGFCHGEGFKRYPCTRAEMSMPVGNGSPFVYKRVPCAGCFALASAHERLRE